MNILKNRLNISLILWSIAFVILHSQVSGDTYLLGAIVIYLNDITRKMDIAPKPLSTEEIQNMAVTINKAIGKPIKTPQF